MASPLNFYLLSEWIKEQNSNWIHYREVISERCLSLGKPTRSTLLLSQAGRGNLPFVRRKRSRQFERSSALPGRKWGLQQGSLLANSWWRKFKWRTGKRNIRRECGRIGWSTLYDWLKGFSQSCQLGEERKSAGSETEVVGNDTLLGQIASFMENLHLSYREVVYEIPYRNLVLMQRDKLHIVTGTKVTKVKGKDMASRRRRNKK